MKPCSFGFLLILIFGFLIYHKSAQQDNLYTRQGRYIYQLPAESLFLNSLKDQTAIIPSLIEEYIELLCKQYNNEIFLFTDLGVVELCKKETDRRWLLLLFVAILFPESNTVMNNIIDNIIGPGPTPPPGPGPVPPPGPGPPSRR